MNVGGAQLERVHHDLVHQPDQRPVRIHVRPRILQTAEVHLGHRHLLDDILERPFRDRLLFAAVIFAQRVVDVLFRGHPELQFGAQQMLQRIDGVQVGGVRQRDHNLAVRLEQGDDAVLFGDVAADQGDHLILDLHAAEVHHLDAELRGLGLRDVPGTDDLVGHQIVHDAVVAGFRTCLGDLVRGCETEVHQHVQQVIVFFCHGIFRASSQDVSGTQELKFSFARSKVNADYELLQNPPGRSAPPRPPPEAHRREFSRLSTCNHPSPRQRPIPHRP